MSGDTTGGGKPDAVGGTFEERLARLGDLVGRLEGGQLGLAESIGAYEQGVALVRSLQAELVDVEHRVRVLTAAAAAPQEAADSQAEDEPRSPAGRKGSGRGQKAAGGGADTGPSRAAPPRVRKLPGMDDGGTEA